LKKKALRKSCSIWLACGLILALLLPTISHAQHEHHEQTSEPAAGIGIDEKLGDTIPLELRFHDENGGSLSLKQLVDKPTILSLVYYTCPSICPRIMSSTAQVLSKLQMDPKKDYTVLTVSFDERDTPALALEKKKNYLKAIGKPFPQDSWRFMTAAAEPIRELTDSVGFGFQRLGDAFEHPAALIILSPDGKIVRYLYGLTYLPFDLKMALTEAQEGKVSPTIRRVLLFCFSYDPEGRTYVFNILKVTGVIVLLFASILILALVIKGRVQNR
jgi:protein SCO1/2